MTLRETAAYLREHGVEEAETEARLLFLHLTGLSPAALLCDRTLSLDTPALREALARRVAREPLAYILGEAPFCNEIYKVSPDCLIPRFDTEVLVEEAARLLPPSAHFCDLCTGSGCIAISTLCRRPDTTAAAYDISAGALALARENAARNGVSRRLRFTEADLLTSTLPAGEFDAILSNPPYITESAMQALSPEVQKEPSLALYGGEDGLRFYRHFVARHSAALKPHGFFLFEIGYDQEEGLRAIAAEHRMQITFVRDLGGNTRVARLSPSVL